MSTFYLKILFFILNSDFFFHFKSVAKFDSIIPKFGLSISIVLTFHPKILTLYVKILTRYGLKKYQQGQVFIFSVLTARDGSPHFSVFLAIEK